jgi:hypothetical protein
MAALYALVTLAALASIGLVAFIVVVAAGIRREEREWSLCRKKAPSLAAWIARRIGGLYVKKTEPEEPEQAGPGRPLPWYERCR